MGPLLQAGDIILQVNWRAYYVVVGVDLPDQYGGDKRNYRFQLLATEERHAAPPDHHLLRSHAYIDDEGQKSWQKVG